MARSNSKQPDLDWSQIRETVKLLTVSVTQVETSMKNGDASVNTLTESFTSLVSHMSSIDELLNSLDSCDEKEAALIHCVQITEKIQTSIVAFQFYDRLQQSLSHVVEGLKGLSELVETPERLYNPSEWKKFQADMRARFTMESEKVMFDAILAGKSIEEAVHLATQVDEKIEDEIELF
ncbi:MAG: hypothetical protein L3J75_02040 [Methylococcaceae bacterium]|nr:hypothetical protein [Methylococcaceae bacterium]